MQIARRRNKRGRAYRDTLMRIQEEREMEKERNVRM